MKKYYRYLEFIVLMLLNVGLCLAQNEPEDSILKESIASLSPLLGKQFTITGSYEEFPAENGARSDKVGTSYDFVTTFVYGDASWIRTICSNYQVSVTGNPNKRVEKEMTFIFDSGKWFSLDTGIIDGGKKTNVQSCRIQKTFPAWLGAGDPNLGSGMLAFLPTMDVFHRRSLEELVVNPKMDFKYKFDIKVVGSKINLSLTDPCSASEVHLSQAAFNLTPEKLIKRLNICGPDVTPVTFVYNFTEKKNLESAGSKLSYPANIERQMTINDKLSNVCQVTIKNIEINVPANRNEITFEPGWLIQDENLGISYMTGQSQEEMLRSIRSILEK